METHKTSLDLIGNQMKSQIDFLEQKFNLPKESTKLADDGSLIKGELNIVICNLKTDKPK